LRDGAPRDGPPRDGALVPEGRLGRASSRSPRYGGRPERAAPPDAAGREGRPLGLGRPEFEEREGRAVLERSAEPYGLRVPVDAPRLAPPLEVRVGRAPFFCSSSSSRQVPARRDGRAGPSARQGADEREEAPLPGGPPLLAPLRLPPLAVPRLPPPVLEREPAAPPGRPLGAPDLPFPPRESAPGRAEEARRSGRGESAGIG
jgi:hypothetical protein